MNNLKIISGAEIGASCYLAELYGVRILFDCGTVIGARYTAHPDIPNPESIDAIFVSHAHIDHMGALAYTAAVCKNAKIYMTEQTKDFVRYQLAATIAEYIGADTDDLKYHNRILCELIMNRIKTVEYNSRAFFIGMNGTRCDFSLFDAGHIPGAAMVYIKVQEKTMLYTGDFSFCNTSLTTPCSLPNLIRPEIMLLCGTHAKNPDCQIYSNDALKSVTDRLFGALKKRSKFVLPVSQLTKGLEVLALFDDLILHNEFPACSVYLEQNLWELARYYAGKSDTFRVPSYVKPLDTWDGRCRADEIVVVFEKSDYDKNRYINFARVGTEFTLHADYDDLCNLIEATAPKQIYVVHLSKKGERDAGIIREKHHGGLVDLIYTENNTVYDI